jgi:hypothetical protein
MSEPDDPTYVGKGRPPRDRQFIKGASGNPKGRPKKPRPGEIPPPNVPFTAKMILASAFEPIRVKKADGSVTEVSSAEAALHALKLKALNGNVHAQKTYLGLVLATDRDRLAAHAQLAGGLIMLKLDRQASLQAWQAAGHDEVDFLMHPDDIQVHQSGEVQVDCLATSAEVEARKQLIALRDRLGRTIDPSSVAFRLMAMDARYAKQLAELAAAYDKANSALPLRYRKPRPDSS